MAEGHDERGSFMKKGELLSAIRDERRRLDELIAPLDDDDLTTTGVIDGQSIKDLLAHITAWEQLCLTWVRTDHRGDEPFTDESLNALNAKMYEQDRTRPLAEVQARARSSYAEILEMVDEQPEAALAKPPRWSERTLEEVIRANTDEHYREHADQIDVWLQGQQA
jgi:hypothetical protein